MAKFVVAGHTCILVSGVKMEDIRKVERFAPEILTLKDEDGNPVFKVTTDHCGEGTFSEFGVEFSCTPDMNGYPIATLNVRGADDVEELKTIIAEEFGMVVTNLAKVEALIPQALEEINASIAAAKAKIEIA